MFFNVAIYFLYRNLFLSYYFMHKNIKKIKEIGKNDLRDFIFYVKICQNMKYFKNKKNSEQGQMRVKHCQKSVIIRTLCSNTKLSISNPSQ